MEQVFAANFQRLAASVPADVEIGFHLCYGDLDAKHFIEPIDATKMVELANLITRHVSRPVSWLYMPVPIDRTDAGFFRPLENLRRGSETGCTSGSSMCRTAWRGRNGASTQPGDLCWRSASPRNAGSRAGAIHRSRSSSSRHTRRPRRRSCSDALPRRRHRLDGRHVVAAVAGVAGHMRSRPTIQRTCSAKAGSRRSSVGGSFGAPIAVAALPRTAASNAAVRSQPRL